MKPFIEIKEKEEVKVELKNNASIETSKNENEWQQEYELIYLSHKLESYSNEF
jgi:hypothetical protein